MKRYGNRIDSPLGGIFGVVDADGAVVELEFEQSRRGTRTPRELEARQAKQGHELVWEGRRLRDVERALDAYFSRELREFGLEVRPAGTPFQQRVWRALLEIPYGRTWSYGELARYLGQPGAARAVGLANGRNPVSIVIPCHRVVGANGTLTGYGGGLEKKRFLLALEQGQTVLTP